MSQHNIWKHLSIATAMALVITACGGGGGTVSNSGDVDNNMSTPTGLDPVVVDTTAPVFTSTNNATVVENQTSAITLVATDDNTVSYSISGGESDSFSVNTSTGVVTFNAVPDFETLDIYTFTATATDTAANSVMQDISITISNVVEIPKKTGQTTTYYAGDDGDYQKGVSTSYTRDDANEIVTDHITGLQWQDNIEAKTITKNWSDAQTHCASVSLDGGRWRLPTRAELVSLSDYGRFFPAIDPTFENTMPAIAYWSSTTYAGYLDYAWSVYFGNGYQYRYYKTSLYSIRCVRAGQ